jgi:plasmid stability protein
MPNGIAKILVRMPEGMKRRLKVAAAMSNKSLNEQIISYLAEGLLKMEEKILSNPRKMMCVEEVE